MYIPNQGANYNSNYKKILRLSYDVIITYDYRKLLSHRKIILRFFCNWNCNLLPDLVCTLPTTRCTISTGSELGHMCDQNYKARAIKCAVVDERM